MPENSKLHTSDKSNYIVHSLSKISHKKWELYVISRIVHLLDDHDLEFVCQQQVRKQNGQRYLVDLYFPQLGLYVEVDEAQHFTLEHAQFDKLRQREILEAANLEEKRIPVYDRASESYRNLSEINRDVVNLLSDIKSRKLGLVDAGQFVPWNISDRYNPQKYISQGHISVEDNVAVRRQVDALRIFGAKFKGYQRGWWNIKGTNQAVWFPRLYTSKTWTNSLSEDGLTIVEAKTDGAKLDGNGGPDTDRVVFGHYKNALGETVYKFVGLFRFDQKASSLFKRVHRRISSKIDIRHFH